MGPKLPVVVHDRTLSKGSRRVMAGFAELDPTDSLTYCIAADGLANGPEGYLVA
jgi:hypothetical protein